MPARWRKPVALLVGLGRKEAGLALVNEAAEAAGRMGFEMREAYARGNVAGALAPFEAAAGTCARRADEERE